MNNNNTTKNLTTTYNRQKFNKSIENAQNPEKQAIVSKSAEKQKHVSFIKRQHISLREQWLS